MALEILHVVKRPTFLALDAGTNPSNVQAGMAGAVSSAGTLVVAGANSSAFVGIFQTQGYVPAYQSTGLLDSMINGAPGNPGGGTKVSLVAGSGAVLKTDQFTNLAGATIGSLVGCDANGQLKVWASGDVVGILIGVDNSLLQESAPMAIIQMRL